MADVPVSAAPRWFLGSGDRVLGLASAQVAAVSAVAAGGVRPCRRRDRAGVRRGPQGRYLGRANTHHRWKRAVIPYEIDAALPAAKQDEVKAAMAHWSAMTPVVFVARATGNAKFYPDYVFFRPGPSARTGSAGPGAGALGGVSGGPRGTR
ncbi:hypothetical protein ACFV4M_01290 [Kitasatospora indigofera]|uniref:hypothetical protein n=1 Tax=Kitasatospora indigofera TaxID=67307 RepID=UPI003652E611